MSVRASKPIGALAIVMVASASVSSVAYSQVMELTVGGGTRVYDAPAVFDGQGSTPITPPRAATTRRRLRSPAAAPASAIAEAAAAAELSPDLVEAVGWRESRHRVGVVSHAGAVGEMQLMPATARELGVDPRRTRANYRGGAVYLRRLMVLYNGDLVRTLAAYNAGPGAVARHGGVPPFPETTAYVAAILGRLSDRSEGGPPAR